MVNDTNSNSNPELAALKQLRERLGMTQEELATELGTTSRTIRRHETGEREIRFSLPQIKRLIELMQRAGMSADDLPDDIEWGGISSCPVTRWQQLWRETEGGDAIRFAGAVGNRTLTLAGSQNAIAFVGVGNAITPHLSIAIASSLGSKVTKRIIPSSSRVWPSIKNNLELGSRHSVILCMYANPKPQDTFLNFY